MAFPFHIAALPLADAGISDIREIVGFPSYWPWLVAAGLLCAAAAFVAWRRRRGRRIEAIPEPVEPPHLKALRLLNALRKKDAELEAEAFTVEVSTILRRYLEDALDLPAPEQTSEEFLQELRDQAWLTPGLQHDLEEFMRLADLVKFARQSLDARQRQRLLDSAVQVIDTTRPKTEPVTH